MSWFNLGRIAAKLVTSAMAAKTALEGESTENSLRRDVDAALGYSFLLSLSGILKDRLGQSAKQLMSHFVVDLEAPEFKYLEKKDVKKIVHLIEKSDKKIGSIEEAVSFLAAFLSGRELIARSWIDDIIAKPFDIETTLTEKYHAYVENIRYKWENVYPYYYDQVIGSVLVEGTTPEKVIVSKGSVSYRIERDLVDSEAGLSETAACFREHQRIRTAIYFFDDYSSYKFNKELGGGWQKEIDSKKVVLRANLGPVVHVFPLVRATCDGLFKDILDEQQHETILRTFIETITSPAFAPLQGQHPYAVTFSCLVASAQPYMKKQVEIQQESASPQRAGQLQPWIPTCPACASALKFKPEHGVWHCAKCDEYYKV